MITMHSSQMERQMDRRTNIMAIAQRFILMNAMRTKNEKLIKHVLKTKTKAVEHTNR